MTEPSNAVFLSYASQDQEAAQRICEALRAAGIDVWFDQSALRGGDVWDQTIRKQIKTCVLFIPVISRHTHARVEGYFRLEWKLAVDRSHLIAPDQPFLLPVVIDETPQTDERIPDKFRELQWSRLPGGETPPAFVERVLRLLSPEAAQAPAQVRPPAAAAPHTAAAPRLPTPSAAASPRPKLVLLLIAAVALMAGGYFALDKFMLSKRSVATLPGESGPSAIPEKSIAVLPFLDLSEKHDQEYFGDGMAEEILNLLVKVPELKVIGRTSSFQFKGRTDDLRKIGTTLGTAYVVEGSVRRSGAHVRVSAQLIDTRDGAHRWSETYDRDASDVLKVQGEIAAGLVRALQLEVAPPIAVRSRSSLQSGAAYDVYLRGLHASNRFDQQGFEEAAADFRRALELDPAFVPAAEALAESLERMTDFGFVPPQTGFEQTRTAAEAALKLDAKSALAHAILGSVYMKYDWNWPAAERELKTAVDLAPNNSAVLLFAALERMAVGRWDEATQLFDAARTTDPLDPDAYHVTGWLYVRLGRLADAQSTYRRTLEISPTYVWGHYFLGIALLVDGKAQAALAEIEQETSVDAKTSGLAVVYYTLHRSKDADASLARLEAEYPGNDAFEIAEIYAFRSQKDQAFKWLDRAYAQKDNSLYYVKGDPLLKNLQSDPRYEAFLRKMNLPE